MSNITFQETRLLVLSSICSRNICKKIRQNIIVILHALFYKTNFLLTGRSFGLRIDADTTPWCFKLVPLTRWHLLLWTSKQTLSGSTAWPFTTTSSRNWTQERGYDWSYGKSMGWVLYREKQKNGKVGPVPIIQGEGSHCYIRVSSLQWVVWSTTSVR